MARDIPATIVAMLAGVAISMTSGFLVASYVTSGVMAGYEPSRRTAAARPVEAIFIDDRWTPPLYDRVRIGFDQPPLDQPPLDQPGVRASGSSRL